MYKEQIRSIYAQLSPGYRRIADFILNSYQDAAFMTSAEIGRAAQVDTALVVRFAQRLGYPGFPELITDVQEHVKQDLRVVYHPTAGDDTPADVFQRNLLQDRNSLDYVLQHFDAQNLGMIINLFSEVARIFVLGEGNASYLADAFAMRLLTMGYPTHAVSTELAGQAAIMAGLRKTDLVIGIGMTAMNPGVAAMISQARELGVKTLGIVPSITNPIALAAEHVLHVPVDAAGVMPSWTTIAAVLHALTQALALNAGRQTAEWALRTDHFLKTYEEILKKGLADVRASIIEYNPGSGKERQAPGAGSASGAGSVNAPRASRART